MRVLIADKFAVPYIDQIRDLGVEVLYEPTFGAAEIAQNVANIDVVVVRSTEVTAEAIEATDNLSLIIRAGAGTNNIDKRAASARGVYVANCPGTNSIAVAELAMGLICALDRRIVENVIDIRNGVWNKAEYSQADGLYGKVLGVIGVGRIGEAMIKRARAFGLHVKAYSRSLTPARADELRVEYAASIVELVPQCDIVSVHLAATSETNGIISKEIINSMKPNACFVNTARAEVVDEAALLEAASKGRIRVATDVYSNEPEGKTGVIANELAKSSNVYGTHHIGASTLQAQNAVAAETVRILEVFLKTGRVENWVNRLLKTPAKWQLVVRHYDKPGVLATVLGLLKEDNVNAEEIENVVFDGAQAACCTIQVDTKPSSQTLKKISALKEQVIHSELMDIG